MPDSNQSPPESIPAPALSEDFVPQFSTVEYLPPPGSEHCRACSSPLTFQYFVVNGQKVCPACAIQAHTGVPSDSNAAFTRAIVFGIGGAILGMCLYAAVTITIGLTFGYFALAVGWIVGKAIMKGSAGLGGTRYQLLACLLTYAAITLTPIPVTIYFALRSLDGTPNLPTLLLRRALHGLVSPFLRFNADPIGAAIGLVIVMIGLSIAWQLTRARPLPINGPYSLAPE
jgi:uncharacterized protein (DUF983 family)